MPGQRGLRWATWATLWVVLWAATPGWAEQPDPYNVVWDSPSDDARGSMPLGNGDISLNAWVEPGGDLLFYIGKTDSWDDNGRLLKIGRLRFRFEPTPQIETGKFRQTLRLRDGTLEVRYGHEATAVVVQVWVDAQQPVIHVTAESQQPVAATALVEIWRTAPYALPSLECSDVNNGRPPEGGQPVPTIVEPDTVLTNQADRIGWYHHNVKSVGPELTMRVQGIADLLTTDPLLHRTFGALVKAEHGQRLDDTTLRSAPATSHRFSIAVATSHPATAEQWLAALEKRLAEVDQTPFAERRRAHEQWWNDFWNRSWIQVTSRGDGPVRSFIPTNALPVKVGVDQAGGNRFQGTLGRVSLFDRALTDKQVAELAHSEPAQTLPAAAGLLGSWQDFPNAALDLADRDLTRTLTIETWVKPEPLPPGGARLVDRITPGGSDGFLLDTCPGNSLRFIVGAQIARHADGLTPGQWHHVVAVADGRRAALTLYLDGKQVAGADSLDGDEGLVVSRGYALQRFITACAGRGRYPIKYNGSTFTMPWPGAPGDGDYRRWGPGYWWQNTRSAYFGACAAGDFDLMQPLFQMYVDDLLPLGLQRTRRYLQHDGAYIPECIYFWGAMFSETYGWTPFEQRGEDKLQSSRWHKWEWVAGPELVCLLLDCYDHTQDEAFFHARVLPTAQAVLTFFDQQYPVDEQGKLVMHPSQALETWWECTNPMPELAGLHAVTQRLLALPERLATAEQRGFWLRLQSKLPELPTHEVDGQRLLAPAAKFDMKRNVENPELYAVFPFRRITAQRGDASLAIEALKRRGDRGDFGWRQDDIFMAYLGLTDEARQYLVGRARHKDANCRFPAFWGPNYDWTPDQTHGGVLMKALQAMALQTDPKLAAGDGGKIYLLPAWPAEWDVRFKLHAPYRTTVECVYRDGQIQKLIVDPPSRRGDVVLPASLTRSAE
ncbi:MAG: DUF5703 domain-containing protein [Planctomycetota bacterium]|nr:DUF5703 domain-containing protein [Planctomycetota bacterium]